MTTRDVADKIRQKVVETFRISGDDESRKGRPIFGYFTFWIIGIPFFLFWFFVFLAMLERRGGLIDKIELWFVANIIEVYVEPFCFGGVIFVVAAVGLVVGFVSVVRDWKFVVAAIGLVVGFVFVVRGWKREIRRRRQLKEK